MGVASIFVGILFLVVILRGSPGKPMFSTTLKVIVLLLFLVFAVYVLFIGMYVPTAVPSLLGRAIACVLIIGIFSAIGIAIRKRRDRRKQAN